MTEMKCPKCGEVGYENQMFMFYSFKCKKCGYSENNLDKYDDDPKMKKMTLGEYYGLPDDV